MASSVGRALTIGVMVLALPAACVGALALYGRALAESEVGVGTLVSPAEGRARLEQARARFRAMTPAEHLAAARRALEQGYDGATRTGGDFGGFEHHAGAIAEGTAEHGELAALRAEGRRRRVNVFALAKVRLGQHIDAHREVATAPADRRPTMRARLACDLDVLSPRGLGCVHVADEGNTTLRFDHPECDQGMLDAIARPDHTAGLRAYGFRQVRCANGQGVIAP